MEVSILLKIYQHAMYYTRIARVEPGFLNPGKIHKPEKEYIFIRQRHQALRMNILPQGNYPYVPVAFKL